MPIAIVVQMVIENQFHMLINGSALLPPMRTLPNLEKQIQMQRHSARKAHKLNSQLK
jgi:hypothetical protein